MGFAAALARRSVLAVMLLGAAGASHAAPMALPAALCAGWPAAGAISLTGHIEADGLSGGLSTTLEPASGRYRTSRDFKIYSEADGFDGALSWSQDRSGAAHALNAAPARAIGVTGAWLRRRGWCGDKAEAAIVEALPDEKDTSGVQTVWRVTPPGGTAILLRFDKAGGLLRQSEIQLPFNRLIQHYADWRGIDGILIPFVERDEDPEDESIAVITIDQARRDRGAALPAAFVLPSRPHDYTIADGRPSTTVPYEDDGVGRIYLPVRIDGQGPFPFELDTGGHFILTNATSLALHLAPVGKANSTGAGTGIVKAGSIRVGEIRIGEAVIRNQSGRVLPLSPAANDRGPRPPRAGLLGLELFERFAVAIDRKAKTVTLTPLERYSHPPGGVILPLSFNEDAPMTPGRFKGASGDFEIDSGDAGPAIIEGYWAREHALAETLSQGLGWSGGGVGGAYRETLSRSDLALGPITLPRPVISFVGLAERGSESTRLQAGVVGELALDGYDMAYDYGRGELWIDPSPRTPPRAFNRAGLGLRKDTSSALTIALVAPGSPAELAGLKLGDQILAIDDREASALSSADASVVFSGPVGKTVVLHVLPKSGGAAREASLRLRDLLP